MITLRRTFITILTTASLVSCLMQSRLCVAADQSGVHSQPYIWKNAPIVGGGFVSGIITHPRKKGLMYARTDIGGAYRRTSPSEPWVPITDWIDQSHWNYEGIESLAIDPQDAKYVYIAGGCYTNNWGGNGAILRSSDQGANFDVVPMPIKMGGNENGRGMGERLMVDPNDGSILLFGSRKNGLWRSVDRGMTWKQVPGFPDTNDTGAIGISTIAFNASSGRAGSATPKIFAGVGSHELSLYQSDDGGKNWSPVPNQPVGLLPHHIIEGPRGTLYITYGNGPGPNDVTDGAVYQFDISSGVWTNITPIAPSAGDKFGYAGLTIDAQHPGTVMVSTLDRWAKTDDLFRSTDAGMHWTSIREKAVRDWSTAPWLLLGQKTVGIGHWISSIQIDPFDSDHLLYDTGWGMWECHDLTATDRSQATHWKVAAQGIEEGVMNDLISPPQGANLLTVMWDIDGFRHDDLDVSPKSGTYSPHYGGDSSIDFAEQHPEIVCRVYGGQPVGGSRKDASCGAYSTDNGVTWHPFESNAAGNHGDGKIAVSADGKIFVWAPKGQPTYFSLDNGKSWQASKGLPAKVTVISDRSEPKTFYAFSPDQGTLYASTDGAVTFKARASGTHSSEGCLKAVPDRAGHLWLATRAGIQASVDGGASFREVPGIKPAYQIGFGKQAPGSAYPAIYVVGEAGGQYGFFRSDDRGSHWIRINDDQHQFAEITAIAGDPRIYGRVYVASRSRGVLYGDVAPSGH